MHRPRGLFRCLAIAAALAIVPVSTQAQSNTDGAIVGQADGADSTVVVESVATGAKYNATVNSNHSFRVGSLPPGAYRVSLTKPGAAPVTKEVMVVVGSTTGVSFDDTEVLETLNVTDTSVPPIDFGKVESSTVLTEHVIDNLPVERTVSGVALLAPGVVRGDVAFGEAGDLISFSGASVAENGYFINGFNVSNFRNGLDPSRVPFEFYNQFEIKTGGFGAEFGRAIGGVINATTKSGSNEFHAGFNVLIAPDSLNSNPPSSMYTDENGNQVPVVFNGADYDQEIEMNFHVSGPLIKDRLFFYGIYNTRQVDEYDALIEGTELWQTEDKDPFYGLKLDAYPFAGHHIEFTTFSDKNEQVTETFEYDWRTETKGAAKATTLSNTGGQNTIVRYTGRMTDNFTASALWGKGEANRTKGSNVDGVIAVYDTRAGVDNWLAGNPDLLVAQASDEREAMRLDLEYAFDLGGSHRLRVGWDAEDNLSNDLSLYSGGGYYRYFTRDTGATVGGGTIPDDGTGSPTTSEVARWRVYENGGSFQVKTSAYYIEDNWNLMSERLNLRLGVRNEKFENLNSLGQAFIDIDNQIAPRIGASYDLGGDKKTKLFFNWGRYHLPIASNTNVRLAGGELFYEEWYMLNSIDPTVPPGTSSTQIGTRTNYSDGTVKDPRTILSTDIDPMYQDELILGVQHTINQRWAVGARFITRDLGNAIDDVVVDHALNSFAARNNYTGFDATGAHAYVLTNPGKEIKMAWDMDDDGDYEDVLLTVDDLQYPEAIRKYYAAELVAERIWDGKWSAMFSYTWSQNYGNVEGWVRSDNGQDDAGITTAFDSPGLVDGTYGFLPNDRRHQFKVYGNYALTQELLLGVNAYAHSGRPINGMGVYPANAAIPDPIATGYGNDSFYVNGAVVPRGSLGRTPWIYNADLSLSYTPRWAENRLRIQLDVFNILGFDHAVEVVETGEDDSAQAEPKFLRPSTFQKPRTVQVSMGIEF